MAELISTGVDELDQILLGGLVPERTYLVEGDPGAGRTTLGLHFAVAGVRRGERTLYVTLAETEQELNAVAAAHGWSLDGIDLVELSPSEDSLRPEAQYTLFHPSEIELAESLRVVLERAEKTPYTRVVIDSLSEIRLLAQEPLRYRRQLLALKGFFQRQQSTVLLLDDRSNPHSHVQVQSMAHGVIVLEQMAPDYGSERRRLRILKMRGRAYMGGYHDFRISRGGLRIYPRILASVQSSGFPDELLSSDLPELDDLLGGGLDRASSTLLVGPAGVGKSTIALCYAVAAARRGERSVVCLFDEGKQLLLKRCRGLGLPIDEQIERGMISLRSHDPAEISPGEFAHLLHDDVTGKGTKMVVIDSLNGYLNAMPDERHLRVQLHELLASLSNRGVTTLLVLAQHGLVGTEVASPVDASYLADSLILFRYYEDGGEVQKALSVLKRRGGMHDRAISKLELGPNRISVGRPRKNFLGILSGVPILEQGEP